MSAASLGLLALRFPVHAAADREGLGRTRAILEAIIREHAAAKDDPWLLIHGIRAMGKDFEVGDGPAVAYLCRRYLTETTLGGKPYLHMAVAHEGHTNAFLAEAVLDSGIEASYAFRANDRDYTIADLVAGAKALFDYDANALSARSVTFNPDDLAFSLIVFAYSTDPVRDEWINAHGNAIRLSAVAEFGLETLENANKLFEDSMRKGVLAEGPDRIHEFTCGGMHLIYGLSTCLRFGHARALAERMKTQFDILVWRLKSDLRLTDRYYDALAGQYPADVVLMHYLDAKLKFLGHALEVLNHARRFNLFVPTAAQEDDIARAHKELFGVVEAIGTDGPRNAGDDKDLFKFLVGDACHAYRGLTMASAA